MLGTCQRFKEAHKDTASAWAATVTATTGVALSLARCSRALGLAVTGTGEHLSGFINPCALSCRAGGSQRACRRNQGVIQGFRGAGSPCSAPCQEPAQPWGRDKLHNPLCAEGNLSGFFFVADETRGCFTSQCNFKRPRMAHDLLSHIPWCVCVCVFSLSLSQSHRAVLIDRPQLQLKVQPASL